MTFRHFVVYLILLNCSSKFPKKRQSIKCQNFLGFYLLTGIQNACCNCELVYINYILNISCMLFKLFSEIMKEYRVHCLSEYRRYRNFLFIPFDIYSSLTLFQKLIISQYKRKVVGSSAILYCIKNVVFLSYIFYSQQKTYVLSIDWKDLLYRILKES